MDREKLREEYKVAAIGNWIYIEVDNWTTAVEMEYAEWLEDKVIEQDKWLKRDVGVVKYYEDKIKELEEQLEPTADHSDAEEHY